MPRDAARATLGARSGVSPAAHARSRPTTPESRGDVRGAGALAAALALGRPAASCRPASWPRACRRSGCDTVGELLEHLPRDSREARTVAALRAGEQATVAVEVRAIARAGAPTRRMRPLVEATVFDATGSMRATFFNQPWLVERYPPGTRLLLHGKADGRGGFRCPTTLLGSREWLERGMAPLGVCTSPIPATPVARRARSSPTTRRPRASPRPRSSRSCRAHADALGRRAEALPRPQARQRGAARPGERAGGDALPARPAEDLETGRARLAFEELLLTQLLFLRRRRRARAERAQGAAPLGRARRR